MQPEWCCENGSWLQPTDGQTLDLSRAQPVSYDGRRLFQPLTNTYNRLPRWVKLRWFLTKGADWDFDCCSSSSKLHDEIEPNLYKCCCCCCNNFSVYLPSVCKMTNKNWHYYYYYWEELLLLPLQYYNFYYCNYFWRLLLLLLQLLL